MKLSLILWLPLFLLFGCPSAPVVPPAGVNCGSPATHVPKVGQYLQSIKMPYCVDALGRPIQVDNLIIQFHDTVSLARIRFLQDTFAPDVIKICPCDDRLQNWIWNEGSPINIEEKTSQVSEAAKGEGHVLYNYITHINNPGQNLVVDGVNQPKLDTLSIGRDTRKLIAILDTGIDYDLVLNGSITLNSTTPPCETAMPYGWNFVGNNSNVSDDNGHGTAVAGIIKESLDGVGEGYQCGERFLILKMLDDRGVGGIFDAICAVRYAVDAGAEVINMSWGYYGFDLDLMRESVLHRRDDVKTIMVTSLGNEGIRIDGSDSSQYHYPSEYANTVEDIIAVSGDKRNAIWKSMMPAEVEMWLTSNYTIDRLMFTGPASKVLVWVPAHSTSNALTITEGRRIAHGTSYATAFVSAAMMITQCCQVTSDGYHTMIPRSDPTANYVHAGMTVPVRRTFLINNSACK